MTRSTTLVDDPLQRKALQDRLEAVRQRNSEILFACLGTVDGRLWSFSSGNEASAPERLAAISSSSLALCEAFARETLRSRCQYQLVATEHGAIVTVRVPSRSQAFALSIGTDASAVVAIALRVALDTASELAAVLDRHDGSDGQLMACAPPSGLVATLRARRLSGVHRRTRSIAPIRGS